MYGHMGPAQSRLWPDFGGGRGGGSQDKQLMLWPRTFLTPRMGREKERRKEGGRKIRSRAKQLV